FGGTISVDTPAVVTLRFDSCERAMRSYRDGSISLLAASPRQASSNARLAWCSNKCGAWSLPPSSW
ncbi:MAG: hypothetical protein AAFX06_33810, partial [Planctomycetota bacterium]